MQTTIHVPTGAPARSSCHPSERYAAGQFRAQPSARHHGPTAERAPYTASFTTRQALGGVVTIQLWRNGVPPSCTDPTQPYPPVRRIAAAATDIRATPS